MARQLSLRRSLAVAAGSGDDGSEGMMKRARRRRLCLLAGSSEREREEWRDWANLLPLDLVEEISGRLLSLDVAEYLRFRAVCRPWRGLTADPRAAGVLLDSRFRPRNWAVLSIVPDNQTHRRLLNLSTAASLGVHLPALSTHCHVCDAADGLLVLFHKPTESIRLLDPLTNALTDFPAISSIVATVPPYSRGDLPMALQHPARFIPRAIDGSGFDDSTSPPTLILCVRGAVATIIFAKPGDDHWTMVSPGQVPYPADNGTRKLLFYTLLSLGGRCYISSPEGSVYLLELQPVPRLVEVVDQRCYAEKDYIWCKYINSLLVRDTDAGGRMLMVRLWRGMERFGGVEAYHRKELFRVGRISRRIEVLEVDIAGRRLVPVRSLGRYALFVGLTRCLHISTDTFPSISADSIYLGCHHQQFHRFSIYRINNKKKYTRTEPMHNFITILRPKSTDTSVLATGNMGLRQMSKFFAPAASPYNLDEYLVYYVDSRHCFSMPCKNHTTICFY